MHASPEFDVAIVGARVAGAATALLLARAGLKVVVLDRTTYGNDTLSTHALMRAGVMQLSRWGLLDDVIASGTPAVRRTTFFVGPDPLVISIKPAFGVDALYAPRRTVLDPMLVDAAAAAGADIRFGITVAGLERGDDGRVTGLVGHDASGAPMRVRARLVVGADGTGSSVAGWVGAETTRRGRTAGAVAYGYWEGLDLDGYEWYFRPGVTAGAIPTNDGLTCVFVGTRPERFRTELAPRPQSGFASLLAEGAPELVDRMRGTRPPSQLRRFPGRPGHLRQSWGPGWALVGDAGYWKDPLSAHGLTDAMRDAELLARAAIDGLDDGDPETELARYQAARDRLSTPLFDTTEAIAGYGWDADAIGALLLQLSSAMTDEVEALAALDVTAPATV
jgi:flavin-dependent dehydrogenase